MNYKDFLIVDFETSSRLAQATQPVQVASIAIHGRKLEIKEGSDFCSLIRPVFEEEECKKLNLDPLSDEAVAVHGKTKAMLESAPTLKSVWSNFTEYVNQYNFNKSSWNAPVMVGYNIRNFDSIIVDRICCKEPWAYGPKDEKFNCQGLFHPIHSIDLLDLSFVFQENNKDVNSLSADNFLRKYLGAKDKGEAHDAMSDVILCAEYFCRMMRLIRNTSSKIKWKGCMA